MGLDGLELVMELEETFGVTLGDEEAAALTTPRQAIDLICSTLATAQQGVCLSQRAFYLLRRALMEETGAARKAIRPEAELRGLVDADRAKELWPALGQALQAQVWPELVRPVTLVAALYALVGAVFIGLFLVLMPGGLWGAAGRAFFVTLIVGLAAFLVSERWRSVIPGHVKRVKDLVPYAGTSEQIEWTREKVALTVKMILIERFEVPELDYREDAHFYRDLGMD